MRFPVRYKSLINSNERPTNIKTNPIKIPYKFPPNSLSTPIKKGLELSLGRELKKLILICLYIFFKADDGPTPPPRRFRKEDIYESLPASLKAEVLVRVRDEDPEVQMQRQELTRSKSPVELSQISSLSEFPIPKNIENMMSKKKDVDDSISNFSSVE
jgi:hypothetical protein